MIVMDQKKEEKKKGYEPTREQTHTCDRWDTAIVTLNNSRASSLAVPSTWSWGSCGEPCGDLPWTLSREGRMSHPGQAICELEFELRRRRLSL